jgi:hypothetical protein
MANKELDEQGYELVVEDSELEVRIDPKEESGYLLCRKDSDRKFILFPRGTLEGLAKSDRDAGRAIINNLAQYSYFIEGSKLNYDSINAIATKAYLKRQEDYQIWKAQQDLESE